MIDLPKRPDIHIAISGSDVPSHERFITPPAAKKPLQPKSLDSALVRKLQQRHLRSEQS